MCAENGSVDVRCAGNSALVGVTVELRECFPHHAKLRLAVELEYLRVALPQHLRHHVIGDAARAQPGREGMPAFFRVIAQTFRTLVRYSLLAVRLGLGNRYSHPGVSSICRRNA